MRVGIVNTYDSNGGAARAAYNLYKNLNYINLDANLLVKSKTLNDEKIIQINLDSSPKEESKQFLVDNEIKIRRTNISNTLFQIPIKLISEDNLDKFKGYDFLNLHWVGLFLSNQNIYNISKYNAQMVWTLHDQAAFTGGCHYTSGCDEFIRSCEICKQVEFSSKNNFSLLNMKEKFNMISKLPLTIVVASRWMYDEVKKSSVFRDKRIEYIPYSIDTKDSFYPVDKINSRNHFKIPTNPYTIIFGADNGNEKRKGFNFLIEALEILKLNTTFQFLNKQNKIQFLSLGEKNEKFDSLGIPISYISRISNDKDLNLFYNSGDLLLLPSTEDNLPLMMLESLSSGTPVIAFKIGGMKDAIIDGKNGSLIPPFDSYLYALEILKYIENEKLSTTLSNQARRNSIENYSNPIEAEKYRDLYTDLLKHKPVYQIKYDLDVRFELNDCITKKASSRQFLIKIKNFLKKVNKGNLILFFKNRISKIKKLFN